MPNPSQDPRQHPRGDKPKNPFTRGWVFWVLILITIILFWNLSSESMTDFKKVGLNVFTGDIAAGRIEKVEIKSDYWQGDLAPLANGERLIYGGKVKAIRYETPYSPDSYEGRDILDAVQKYNASDLVKQNKKRPIELVNDTASGRLWMNFMSILLWGLGLAGIFLLFMWYMRASAGQGIRPFLTSRAKMVHKEHTKVTFDDVAGIEEAKAEVQEVVEFLKNPEKFRRLGGRLPRGVLLVGRPGTGKTLLAKAIAGEADTPFFSISGSDFVEVFVGVGASRVRDLFQQAKAHAPCVIFLDEIDAIGRVRGSGLGGGHDEREQTLNAILVEMDGFDTDDSVIVIAATNRPDVLDPALRRPGRFDREIVVDLPDVKGREAILAVHAKRIKLQNSDDLKVIARSTPTFSGADLESLVNEAAILASMREQESVTLAHLEEARDRVMWGREKRSKTIGQRERRMIAFHEAGHAIAAHLLPDAEPLHKVAIIPRGMMLGATMHLPAQDEYLFGKRKALAEICTLMAGRVAEELFCDDITAGAASDLVRATDLARRMICQWGMTETLGPVVYREVEEHLFLGREISRTQQVSAAISDLIDKEIRKLLDEGAAKARQLLTEHQDHIRAIVEELLKREVLTAAEVDQIVHGQRLPDVPNGATAPVATPTPTDTNKTGTASTDPSPAPAPAS